jgi:hypothetical protein
MPQVNLNLVSPKFISIQPFYLVFLYSEFTELIFLPVSISILAIGSYVKKSQTDLDKCQPVDTSYWVFLARGTHLSQQIAGRVGDHLCC